MQTTKKPTSVIVLLSVLARTKFLSHITWAPFRGQFIHLYSKKNLKLWGKFTLNYICISYRIFLYWFATDTPRHFETITRGNAPSVYFKISSSICIYNKPIKNISVTYLYYSHA